MDAGAAPVTTLPPVPEPALTGYQSEQLGAETYDFYRCGRCNGLITQLQLVAAMHQGKALRICPCGGLKFSPTNPLWYEYGLPRVWAFAWQRARALGVAGIRANMAAKR